MLGSTAMRLPTLSKSGWAVAACLVGSVLWACSSEDTNPFTDTSGGGTGGADTGGGGSSGASTGGTTGGSTSGGSSGSSSGGDATGGTASGGTLGDGGDAGTDAGGTATGGTSGVTGGAGASGAAAGDGGKGGSAGTPAAGAGMGGAGTAGAGAAGAGMSGGGAGGGMPGNCTGDDDCDADEYCKKASCDAAMGSCTARGPECRGSSAAFEPVCGCDGITYWNTCVIEHEGFNVALHGECTGNDRPTCTRVAGGDSCPPRGHAHCYRPVEECGDSSPTTGVCWVLPTECPPNEAQTERYCGGTAGSARCIGLCEVIDAENSFRRDSALCN
jgi:Kazal-type serine protease inhibitor-like protein